MRLVRIFAVVLFLVCASSYVGSTMWETRMKDPSWPEIVSAYDSLELDVKEKDQRLMEGLTASDAKDGDLTEHILLENISGMDEEGNCQVKYVVFDGDNHATEFVRATHFTGYHAPRFTVDRPLIFEIGTNFQFLDNVSAWDALDGDISGKIKLKSSSIDSFTEGVYPVKLEVTDNYGTIAGVNLNVVVCSGQATMAQVELNKYLIYLNKGDTYNSSRYIASATGEDGERIDRSQVKVTGRVNVNKAGIYQVSFSVGEDDVVYQTVVVE